MKDFLKKHRTGAIVCSAVAAVLLVGTAATVGVVTMTGPVPDEVTAEQKARSIAASADDWSSLVYTDEDGKQVPLLDAKGNPIVDTMGNPVMEPENSELIPAGTAEEKRSADMPLPAVKVNDGVSILDTTAVTGGLLQLSLGTETSTTEVRPDKCLLEWAKEELPKVQGDAFSGVKQVCGRDAAVMYGGYSTSVRDLTLHAVHAPDKAEREALSKVLHKKALLGYASVATEDGRGVLLIAAAANADTEKSSKDGNTTPPFATEPVDGKKPKGYQTPP